MKKTQIFREEIWVKNFPREQWRRNCEGSPARGWGNRLGRQCWMAPGWGAAASSPNPFQTHFPSLNINYKAVGK